MTRYVALENIDYESLQLNKSRRNDADTSQTYNPDSLLRQSCRTVCRLGGDYSGQVMTSVPSHLATTLLKEAIHSSQASAIAGIIANWPLPVLSFSEVLGPGKSNAFEEEMDLDLVVFKGVTARTNKCRIKLLDFRGFHLNWKFSKLVIQMWPLLSLKKSQRNVRRLTNLVVKVANLKKDYKLTKEIIPNLIDEVLSSDMAKHPRFTIHMPKGERMCVRIDRLEFSTQNTFFMDYLITNCLRSITPVHVVASNIIIRSDLNIGDEVMDSLAPFIVFRGHDTKYLEGIWLENLEDNVFFITSHDLHVFQCLKGLAVPNCNIMLQAGRTRRRTSVRTKFTQTLSSFSHLVRLDLSQNCFAGCLPEILDALTQPLEYLCLRECDLLDSDMQYLADCKHTTSIQQLNVSKICGLFPEDNFAVDTGTLVRSLKNFTSLRVLHMQQNQITDPKIADVCVAMRSHWHQLKSLNISDNIFASDSALKIVEACVERPSMQHLRIPYSHNLFDAINLMENGRQEFSRRVGTILERHSRTDMEVEVFSLAYAVFANIQ